MVKLLCIINVCLLYIGMSCGCVSVEQLRERAAIAKGFQPEGKGVKDLHEFTKILDKLYEKYNNEVFGKDEVYDFIHKLTWGQACDLYREHGNDAVVLDQIMRTEVFSYGIWTKNEVISLLGHPNEISPVYLNNISILEGAYTRADVIKLLSNPQKYNLVRCIGYSNYLFNFDMDGHLVGTEVGD